MPLFTPAASPINATIVEAFALKSLCATSRERPLFIRKKKKCGDALIVEGKRLDLQGQTMRQTQHSKYRPHHRHPLR